MGRVHFKLIGGEIMSRVRRFKTPKAMEDAWEEYKVWCDNQNVLTHDFSAKNSEFVSAELKRSITYTIEGFCVWMKMPRAIFYQTYSEDERYSDIVTRIREECEVDARTKFELGLIEPRLAALWMSKHGYSTKVDSTTEKSANGSLQDLIAGLKE